MKSESDHPTPFSFDVIFENDPVLGPSAHVVVRFCSKGEDGTTYLTPDCKTAQEWNHQIDRLQSELERLRSAGLWGFIESINGYKRKRKKK